MLFCSSLWIGLPFVLLNQSSCGTGNELSGVSVQHLPCLAANPRLRLGAAYATLYSPTMSIISHELRLY